MSAFALTPARSTTAGRHRRAASLRTLDTVGRLGSVVTLASLLVVGGAVGGLFDGSPATADASVTATLDGGH